MAGVEHRQVPFWLGYDSDGGRIRLSAPDTTPPPALEDKDDDRVELDLYRTTAAFEAAATRRPAPVRALTFIKVFESNARPVAFSCDDGIVRVVKRMRRDSNLGRGLVNDHLVAHLGRLLGAPTGEPDIVEVTAELIAAEARISHLLPGIGHGTRFIEKCTDREGVLHTDLPENRERFALLAVLYGWALAGDHQLIYKTEPPALVYSVDHGHFFPGSQQWDVAQLAGAPDAAPDPVLVQVCRLTPAELAVAASALLRVTIREIIDAVSRPLDEWGLTIVDRVALLRFLIRRRAQLLTQLLV